MQKRFTFWGTKPPIDSNVISSHGPYKQISGAEGLIRAYGGTARMALRSADKKVLIPKVSPNAGQIYSAAARNNGVVEGETCNDQGDLEGTETCDAE